MRKRYINLTLILLTLFPLVSGAQIVIGGASGAGIPDDDVVGCLTESANVTATTTIADVNVELNITHTWAGDIVASVTSPTGTEVLLVNGRGGSNQDFTNTIFDDEGADGPIAAGNAPFTGSYTPENPLSGLDGETLVGTWSLKVCDNGFGDVGTLDSWNISITEAVPQPGDLIITEIMQNPNDVSDGSGEYFEIYNTTGSAIDIDGWEIKDDGADSHTINNGGALNVPAGGYIVLGNNGTSGTNGGVTVDYQYSSFNLSNSDDEIILNDGTTDIARVEYDGGTIWPDPTGKSMVFIGCPTDNNNDGSLWAESTQAEGINVDFGSPGAGGVLWQDNFIAGTTSTSCPGASTGAVDITTTGGVSSSYSYAWSNGLTTEDISGLSVATYTVTVDDANGCQNTRSFTVTELNFSASVTVDSNATCSGFNDGGLTAGVIGGTPTYNYAWSNGASTASATGIGAGTYTVTVSETGGCSVTATESISQPAGISFSSTVTDISCNGETDGSAMVSSSGGPVTTSYTYTWADGQTGVTVTGLGAGATFVTITSGECVSNNFVSVTEPNALVVSANVTSNYNGEDISCNGANDGEATATVSGGTGTIAYLWSNGQTTAVANGLMGIGYTVTVTDDNGCTTIESVTVTEPNVLVNSQECQPTTGNGNSDGSSTTNVSGGTGSYTYLWSNGATTASITGVPTGSYSITTTDANGCTAFDNCSVTEDPCGGLAGNGMVTDISCNGNGDGSIMLSPTGGTSMNYTYMWSNDSTTSGIADLVAGTYDVTVMVDACPAVVESYTVTEPTTLVASAIVDSNETCFGALDGGATASATGGTMPYGYEWNNTATSATIVGVNGGNYSVTVSDANGCESVATVTISGPSALTVTQTCVATSGTGNSDGSSSVTVSGGTTNYSYIWSNGVTTANNTGLLAGSYTVTTTDANGCVAIDNCSVTDDPCANLMGNGTVDSTSCNGNADGAIMLSPTGGTSANYTYMWSNDSTTSGIADLEAGTYSVTVMVDACPVVVESYTVSEPTALVAMAVVDSNATCNGASNGGATVTASGGTSPYTYAWDNLDVTPSITGAAAGTYIVSVADNNACIASDTVMITEPAVLALTQTCAATSGTGASDGSSTAMVTGGSTPYSYDWGSGATTVNTSTGLSAGTVTVTVTDANGCMMDESCTVVDDPCANITVSATTTDVTCNGEMDGTATGMMTGGFSTDFTYEWSNDSTTAMIAGLDTGAYQVIITDGNNCIDSAIVTIAEPAALTITATAMQPTCGGAGSDGEVMVMATGGPTTNYTYMWTGGDTTTTVTGLMAGTYHVTVMSGVCAMMDSLMLTEPTPDSITVNEAICEGESYMAGGSAQTTAGTYVDNYTNAQGCDSVVTTHLTVNANPTVGINNTSTNLCEGDMITLNGNGAAAYAWDNGVTNGVSFAPAAGSTEFMVTGTDANGCTGTSSITVTVNAAPTVTYTENIDNCIDSITVSPSGASYTWTTPTGTVTTSSNVFVVQQYNTSQDFTLKVTDGNACNSTIQITVVAGLDCTTIGLEEETAENTIAVYPNPTKGNVVLEVMNFEMNDKAAVTITNAVGQVVYQTNISNSTSNISLNEPSGVYFMNVQLNDKVITKRLTISK